MRNAQLKILATAYDANGEMTSYAIGIGTKWFGSVNRKGRFFEAKIGPAQGRGMTPDNAAQNAWHAFCDWQPDHNPVYGFARPGSVDMVDATRVTIRTTKRDAKGKGTCFKVYVGGKLKGEVRRQRDGKFLAIVGEIKRIGQGPMEAARLGWLRGKDLG